MTGYMDDSAADSSGGTAGGAWGEVGDKDVPLRWADLGNAYLACRADRCDRRADDVDQLRQAARAPAQILRVVM